MATQLPTSSSKPQSSSTKTPDNRTFEPQFIKRRAISRPDVSGALSGSPPARNESTSPNLHVRTISHDSSGSDMTSLPSSPSTPGEQWTNRNGSPSASQDNSVYSQVRASAPATDQTDLSINTPRMWSLSLLFSVIGSASNLFFSLRYPSITITPIVALLLAHPLGCLWDRTLKRANDITITFESGNRLTPLTGHDDVTLSRWQRLRLWCAQGHWNEKEHACVYVSSNVSFGFAFATDIIVEQHKFYKQDVSLLYQVLLTLSTQILGYAFAGMARRFLVRPPNMIWPATLMSTSMFMTMHNERNEPASGWTISRWRFFSWVWMGSVAWYLVPGLLMPALSYFNALTWIDPNNVILSNLFGVSHGLGLFPVTFDWAQLAYIGSPLVTPWWAAANVFGGLAVVMWIFAPILYYTNTFFSSFLPILSSNVYDDTAAIYDVSKIIDANFLFDEKAFKRYSNVFLPITYALSYGSQFASVTALIVHTICFHGKEIARQARDSWNGRPEQKSNEYQPLNGHESYLQASYRRANARARSQQHEPITDPGDDIHSRLMDSYDDCPLWWYAATLLVMLAVAIFVVEFFPVHLPWYGILLAVSITGIMFLPIAIVAAITNQHSSLYLVGQVLCGFLFPGRPVANMVFTTYLYISSSQAVKFSSDLKLGHYMKVPPRLMFGVQMVATVVSSLTQIGVLNWMFSHIPNLCEPEASNGLTCPLARVHFNGSVLWGLIGPRRFFGNGALYQNLSWFLVVGAMAPFLLWLAYQKTGKTLLQKINFPLIFGSLSWIPPATGLNFSGWALMSFAFNYVLARRAHAWWTKYTMTLSAALDSGLAFGLIFVFFAFVYPGLTQNFHWWGTEVYKQGCDWKACAYLLLPASGHFGPNPES